jgi:hypothetical protein
MVKGGSDGGRRMEGYDDGYSARFSDYSLNAKDNFVFDRTLMYRHK